MKKRKKSLVGWMYKREFPYAKLPFTDYGKCFSLFPKLNPVQRLKEFRKDYVKVRITIQEL